MKLLSSFTHPQVVTNLYECLCSAEHKGRYSEGYWKQISSGAPLTSISFFFSYYGSQWCPKTVWLQTFFKISSFVFGRTKKVIQVWNYLWVSKWRQNFHFWVNYPFNFLFPDALNLLKKACRLAEPKGCLTSKHYRSARKTSQRHVFVVWTTGFRRSVVVWCQSHRPSVV